MESCPNMFCPFAYFKEGTVSAIQCFDVIILQFALFIKYGESS